MFVFGSCKTDDSIRTKFPWIPSIAAPRHYPVQIKYAFVDFGTKDKRIPVYVFITIEQPKLIRNIRV